MIQDIYIQHRTAFASGATTTYIQVPYTCTVRDVKAIVQADPGDAETLTLTTGTTIAAATALGTVTFGTDIAAGAVGTWAANATTGNTVIQKDSYIKVVTSAASAADCDMIIELDPHART